MHAVVGLHDISDTQCGFKFFQRQVALDLFRRQRIDGYMYDVEILYLAEQAGYRIVQVPIRWRDDGDSRLQLFRGNLRNAVDILRLRLMDHTASGCVGEQSTLVQDNP
jgi:dolichyl-phosphate beta-glucosyltransferase